MKMKRLPKKTRNKIKVFVLFLFLSICLKQDARAVPDPEKFPPRYPYPCLAVCRSLSPGIYRTGEKDRGKPAGRER